MKISVQAIFLYTAGTLNFKLETLNVSSAVRLSSDDTFQETSARYRAVEPEQWLQRHPEAGSSWPSWPQASQEVHVESIRKQLVRLCQPDQWLQCQASGSNLYRAFRVRTADTGYN